MAQDSSERSPSIEQVRRAAANRLPAACAADFLRLSKTILYGPASQWLLVEAPSEPLRLLVMNALDGVLSVARLRVNRLPLTDRIANVQDLESRLVKNAADAEVVHVIAMPGWFTRERWDAFNVRRERVASQASARLVFWLDSEAIAQASLCAPDLWAWRAGVYAFNDEQRTAQRERAPIPRQGHHDSYLTQDTRTEAERRGRVVQIQEWIKRHTSTDPEARTAPLEELASLYSSLGEHAEALRLYREFLLPVYEQQPNRRQVATIHGRIADALEEIGREREALTVRCELELPALEHSGEELAVAVTKSKIADILSRHDFLDEALQLLIDESLKVFERLGNNRYIASTKAKIAEILYIQDRLDEALHLLRDEVIPMFEQIGDRHHVVEAQARLADIYSERGQISEALQILRRRVLPFYVQQGDVPQLIHVKESIADLLEARGQLAEAHRIRSQEVLPHYEERSPLLAALTKKQIARFLARSPSTRVEAEKLDRQAETVIREPITYEPLIDPLKDSTVLRDLLLRLRRKAPGE